jgi:hypothetical protein
LDSARALSQQTSSTASICGASSAPIIALELARECASVGSPVRGVGMMNCGVGMNNKNALKVEGWRARQAAKGIDVEPAAEGWQLAFIGAVLALVDAIFNNRWLLTLILDKFATADNVRSALQRSVYVNPECVTDDLVDDYLSLATDKEAAVEVLRQIYRRGTSPMTAVRFPSTPPTPCPMICPSSSCGVTPTTWHRSRDQSAATSASAHRRCQPHVLRRSTPATCHRTTARNRPMPY